jgi:hypothetical protein
MTRIVMQIEIREGFSLPVIFAALIDSGPHSKMAQHW